MNETTKEKILIVAHKLFADKGFNGVSIREIAKASDVNIAAINYHFSNKENLYKETISNSLIQTSEQIKEVYDSLKEKKIESFSLEVFNLFITNSEDLKTAFKLIMTSNEQDLQITCDNDDFTGPPGGEHLYACLKLEFPNCNEENLLWAVRTIFTQVIHKALVFSNKSLCQNAGVTADDLKLDLLRLVKVVKNDIN